MALLSITSSGGTGYEKRQSTLVTVDSLNATFIYLTSGAAGEIRRVVTSDGGTTWAADALVTDPESFYTALAVWYAQWTPSAGSNTKIYIGFGANSNEYAGSLTSAGVVSDPITVMAASTGFPGAGSESEGQICMGENGNVYMLMMAASTDVKALWRSTDDMATAMTLVWSDASVLGGVSNVTKMRMIPSPSNANDMMLIAAIPDAVGQSGDVSYIIWHDDTQAWDLAWTPFGPYTHAGSSNDKMLDAQLRLADRKVFVVYVDDQSQTIQTMRSYCIDVGLAVAQLPDILLFDGTDTFLQPALSIDQQSGALYVAYIKNDAGAANVKSIEYKRSRQSGNTWSDPVVFAATAESDIESVIVPASTPQYNQSWFQPVYYDDGLNVWRTEDSNQVVVAGGYTVRELADGGADEKIVDCQSGQTSQVTSGGDGQDTVRISATPYPTTTDKKGLQSTVTWMPYLSKTSGTFSVGDTVKGATSKATGIVTGFLTNPTMIGLRNVKNGPGPGAGIAFRPNELINNQTQTGQLSTPNSLRAVTSTGVQPSSANESSADI